MKYWLLKTEPTAFSLEDLARAPRRRSAWDGVRNYQARNFIRDEMQVGDEALVYYSSCPEPGIAGIVRIVSAAYPDPSAFARGHVHFDALSKPEAPRWFMMDVALKRRLRRMIPLMELRAHATGKLDGMLILRPGNRLSITPLSALHWRFILSLE